LRTARHRRQAALLLLEGLDPAPLRDQVGAVTAALDAQRQFWLADAALQASVIGRPTNTTLSVTTSAPSDAAAGH